jgi:hypothetical protein
MNPRVQAFKGCLCGSSLFSSRDMNFEVVHHALNWKRLYSNFSTGGSRSSASALNHFKLNTIRNLLNKSVTI